MKNIDFLTGRMNEAYALINMYSGACHMDPRVELSEESADFIMKKLSYLSKPFKKEDWQFQLSDENYLVVVPQLCAIYVSPCGQIKLMTEFYDNHSVDTDKTIHNYLKNLLAPALEKHRVEAKATIEKHHEEMFRVSEQNKI